MALTQLSDVVVPEVFFTYMAKDTMTKSAIFNSGAVRQDPALAEKLAGGGEIFQIPYWKDLTDGEAQAVDDDPSHLITPDKIGTFKMRAPRQFRAKAWSDADLVAELAGSDPMDRIRSRVGAWWARQFQTQLIQTLKGVFADNTANDSADMTYDATAVGTGVMTAEAILEAAQTMGDASNSLKMLVMHSRVYTTLAKANLIDFIPDSNGVVRFPTYLGYNVVVDDGVETSTSGSDVTYRTYLLGEGVIGWAESPPAVPVAVKREELEGYGAGIETLVTRRQYIMHPYGFDWLDASVAAKFPVNSELAAAANWNRVWPERKQIAIARVLTKNG